MQVDVNLPKCIEIADTMVKYIGNLRNTSLVFEEMVANQSKKSGSEFLGGLLKDSQSVRINFEGKARTCHKMAEDMRGYMKKIDQANRL